MSYREIVKDHSIHKQMEVLESAIGAIINMEDKPAEDIDGISRVQYVLQNFKTALRNCEENLIAKKWLDDAHQAMVNVGSQLYSYRQDMNSKRLSESILPSLDTLLEVNAKINSVRNRQTLRGLSEAFDTYVKNVDTHNSQFIEKAKHINEQMELLNVEAKSQQEQINKEFASLQTKIDKEQSRIDQFATAFEQQRTDASQRLSDLIDDFKSRFTANQDEGKTAFIESQQKFENEHKDLIEDYKTRFAEYEEQVKNIVGKVNTNMFSYKYKEVADDAKKRARIWHIATVVIMVLIAVFAVCFFIINVETTNGWTALAAKIFTTTTMAAAAAYTARQASKLDKVERYARIIEMQLVAIDPFIESLDKENKDRIKEELTFKLFGKEDVMELSNKEDDIEEIVSLNKTVTELIKLIKQ